jgi:hypothetical protein
MATLTAILTVLMAGFRGLRVVLWLLGVCFIPPSKVGMVEKLWSLKGLRRRGRIVGRDGQAGLQAEVLPSGLHLFYFPWQYRVHKLPAVAPSALTEAGRRSGCWRRLGGTVMRWLFPDRASGGTARRSALGPGGPEQYLEALARTFRQEQERWRPSRQS